MIHTPLDYYFEESSKPEIASYLEPSSESYFYLPENAQTVMNHYMLNNNGKLAKLNALKRAESEEPKAILDNGNLQIENSGRWCADTTHSYFQTHSTNSDIKATIQSKKNFVLTSKTLKTSVVVWYDWFEKDRYGWVITKSGSLYHFYTQQILFDSDADTIPYGIDTD